MKLIKIIFSILLFLLGFTSENLKAEIHFQEDREETFLDESTSAKIIGDKVGKNVRATEDIVRIHSDGGITTVPAYGKNTSEWFEYKGQGNFTKVDAPQTPSKLYEESYLQLGLSPELNLPLGKFIAELKQGQFTTNNFIYESLPYYHKIKENPLEYSSTFTKGLLKTEGKDLHLWTDQVLHSPAFDVKPIIPVEVLEKNKDLQELLHWAGTNNKKWNYNGYENGLLLPSGLGLTDELTKGVSGTGTYAEKVNKAISDLKAESSSMESFYLKFEDYSKNLKKELVENVQDADYVWDFMKRGELAGAGGDALTGLVKDSRGVYGYLPKEGSRYFKSVEKFMDADWVAKQRNIRLDYLKGSDELESAISAMRAENKSSEVIARNVVEKRNLQKVEARKNMLPEEVKNLEEGNMKKYQNPVGPTADQLHTKYGGDWEKVIEASMRKDPEINALLGIIK